MKLSSLPLPLLLLFASSCRLTVAFAVRPRAAAPSRRAMFSADGGAPEPAAAAPLEPVASSAEADALEGLHTAQTPRSIVKDMNTGEIKEVRWVDPAMHANTRPWEMNWWAYPLVLFPFVLLFDDVFHFLPNRH